MTMDRKMWLITGAISMLILLSVAIFQMAIGNLETEIVFVLYQSGLSETSAQTVGPIVFWGLLVFPSIAVLLATGVLVWTTASEPESL